MATHYAIYDNVEKGRGCVYSLTASFVSSPPCCCQRPLCTFSKGWAEFHNSFGNLPSLWVFQWQSDPWWLEYHPWELAAKTQKPVHLRLNCFPPAPGVIQVLTSRSEKAADCVTENKGVLDRSHSAKSVIAEDNSYNLMISGTVIHVAGRHIGAGWQPSTFLSHHSSKELSGSVRTDSN